MSFKIFGFEISREKKESQSRIPLVVTSNNEGSVTTQVSDYNYNAGNMSGCYVYNFDLNGQVKNSTDMLKQYRLTACYPDVDTAIEHIVNDAVIAEQGIPPVRLNTDNIGDQYSTIKESIQEHFEKIINLLKFNANCHDIFKRWYIDGRMYYYINVDREHPTKGIISLDYIDPTKIRKMVEYIREKDPNTGMDVVTDKREYYVFNDKGLGDENSGNYKLSTESVINVQSGLVDPTTKETMSYLFKAIKPANQLKMMEDAAVIYRITRAPERRVFYIDVGNLPSQKAEQYVDQIMNKFRNKVVYNPDTGEVKNNRQYLSILEDFWLPRREGGKATEIQTLPGACLSMDTKVSLLDGRELSIREIETELNSGKTLWTYSCHPTTGRVVPGLISWAGVTKNSAQVMKITLDSGESITCTLDHKFPIKDVGFVEAKDLKVNDSLIPLYRRKVLMNSSNSEYEQFFDNESHDWNFTHRVVADFANPDFDEANLDSKKVVHHVDFNRFNNNPENLTIMSWKDHSKLHSEYGFEKYRAQFTEEEYYQLRSEMSKDYWKKHPEQIEAKIAELEAGRKALYESLKEAGEWEDYCDKFVQCGKKAQETRKLQMQDPRWRKTFSDNCKLAAKTRDYESIVAGNSADITSNIAKYSVDYLKENKYGKYLKIGKLVDVLNSNSELLAELKQANTNKHGKIRNVDHFTRNNLKNALLRFYKFDNWDDFSEAIDLLNHRIVKIEYLDDPIEVGTLTIDVDEKYHNYHTFALSCGVFTKNSNIGEMNDISYFQNKLYQSLNVPRNRLLPDNVNSLGGVNEVTREEIVFSKFIQRLRNKFNLLFLEALRVELLLTKVIDEEDWDEIKNTIYFEYQHDNYFEELKRIEIQNQKLTQLQQADGYKGIYFSKKYIVNNILGINDDLWDELNKEMHEEKLKEARENYEIENIADTIAAEQGSSEDGESDAEEDLDDDTSSGEDESDDQNYQDFVDGKTDTVDQSGDTTDTINTEATPNPGEDNFERPAEPGLKAGT